MTCGDMYSLQARCMPSSKARVRCRQHGFAERHQASARRVGRGPSIVGRTEGRRDWFAHPSPGDVLSRMTPQSGQGAGRRLGRSPAWRAVVRSAQRQGGKREQRPSGFALADDSAASLSGRVCGERSAPIARGRRLERDFTFKSGRRVVVRRIWSVCLATTSPMLSNWRARAIPRLTSI